MVGLNSKRQRQGIYEPFAQGVGAAVENLISPRGLARPFPATWSNSRLGTFWEWYRRHWFSWRGGLVAVGFSLVARFALPGCPLAAAHLRRLGLVGAGTLRRRTAGAGNVSTAGNGAGAAWPVAPSRPNGPRVRGGGRRRAGRARRVSPRGALAATHRRRRSIACASAAAPWTTWKPTR